MTNYRSATGTDVRDKVEQTIRQEIRDGNYIITSTKPTIVSALGAVPKQDSNNIRLIHDCSRPDNGNLNSYANEAPPFSFVTIDHATSLIKPNAFLAKLDLKSAYRHVPLHPSNYEATGLAWTFAGDSTPTYLYDCKLPFGSSKSPEIFNRLTQAVTRIMARRGHTILAYLDDFLIIADTEQDCRDAYLQLIDLLHELGFNINWNKAVEPCQNLTFLGIEINSVLRQLTLPDSKLCEMRSLLSGVLNKRKLTKRDLQSLAGKLNFAARVIHGGRTFLRRIIDAINSTARPHHHIRITQQLRLDLTWWRDFMYTFNGKAFFVESEPIPLDEFSTDACPSGGGGYFRGDWFYVNWRTDYPHLQSAHINLQETFTVLVAIKRWKHALRGKWIIVHTDNMTTLSVINKGTSRNPQAMRWLRELFWLSAMFNFRITARFISTSANWLADAISRLHCPTYCEYLRHNMPSNMDLTWGSHLSSNALASLPFQVQCMLRNRTLIRN